MARSQAHERAAGLQAVPLEFTGPPSPPHALGRVGAARFDAPSGNARWLENTANLTQLENRSYKSNNATPAVLLECPRGGAINLVMISSYAHHYGIFATLRLNATC